MKYQHIVLFTTKDFGGFGGIERYIENFIKYFSIDAACLTLLVPEQSKNKVPQNDKIKYEFYEDDLNPIRNFFRFLNPIRSVLQLKSAFAFKLKQIKPDAVLTRDLYFALAVMFIDRRAPVFFMPGSLLKMDIKLNEESIEGSIFYRLSRFIQGKVKIFLEQLAFRCSKKIVVFSQSFKKRIIENYNIPEQSISILQMGIDFREIETDSSNIEKNMILSVGRLSKSKNYNMALDVIDKLPDFKLLIAGEGKERKDLEGKIKKLGLDNRVILLGRVDNPEQYYRKCNIFMHLSYYENLGQVLLEAMMYGKPPIVLNPTNPDVLTASAEVIRNGYNGFFVENDPNKIAKKIRYIASLDRKKIAENCKEFVKRYSFKNHLNELFGVINEN